MDGSFFGYSFQMREMLNNYAFGTNNEIDGTIEEIANYLYMADIDYYTAKYLFSSDDNLLAFGACNHTQQAIEKYLCVMIELCSHQKIEKNHNLRQYDILFTGMSIEEKQIITDLFLHFNNTRYGQKPFIIPAKAGERFLDKFIVQVYSFLEETGMLLKFWKHGILSSNPIGVFIGLYHNYFQEGYIDNAVFIESQKIISFLENQNEYGQTLCKTMEKSYKKAIFG